MSKKQKQKSHRIFELTIVRAWLIFGVLFAHILMFINIYNRSNMWNMPELFDYLLKFETGRFFTSCCVLTSCIMYFTQGVTLSFSRHNGKRAFSMFVIFLISLVFVCVELFIINVFNIHLFDDIGLIILSFGIFGFYAVCMFLFKYIIKLPFNYQFAIFIVLLIPSLLSLYYFDSPTLNPLQWIGAVFDNEERIISDIGTLFNTCVIFPYIAFFSLGTLVGQIYYKNKISPFVTEKYLNFMQKNPITRFILWSGDNTGKIFIWHWWFFPVFFFLLTLLIKQGLPM